MFANFEVARPSTSAKLVYLLVGKGERILAAQAKFIIDNFGVGAAADSCGFAMLLVGDADVVDGDTMLGAVKVLVHD